MKKHNVPALTKCSKCELLQAALLKVATDVAHTPELISQRGAHFEYVVVECSTYRLKTELGKTDPRDYLTSARDAGG